MLSEYLPILILFGVGVIVCAAMVGGSRLLGPKKPTPAKSAPYECGVEPVGSTRDRWPVKFFLVAILFIIFDIESIFLYPWYTVFRRASQEFKVFTLIEVGVFFFLLVVGYLYVVKKNAIDFDEGTALAEDRERGVRLVPDDTQREEVA